MPHVIVKMYAGRQRAEKQALADEITSLVERILGYGPEAISVSIEDVAPREWTEKVYRPDIAAKPDRLFKKPGYNPL